MLSGLFAEFHVQFLLTSSFFCYHSSSSRPYPSHLASCFCQLFSILLLPPFTSHLTFTYSPGLFPPCCGYLPHLRHPSLAFTDALDLHGAADVRPCSTHACPSPLTFHFTSFCVILVLFLSRAIVFSLLRDMRIGHSSTRRIVVLHVHHKTLVLWLDPTDLNSSISTCFWCRLCSLLHPFFSHLHHTSTAPLSFSCSYRNIAWHPAWGCSLFSHFSIFAFAVSWYSFFVIHSHQFLFLGYLCLFPSRICGLTRYISLGHWADFFFCLWEHFRALVILHFFTRTSIQPLHSRVTQYSLFLTLFASVARHRSRRTNFSVADCRPAPVAPSSRFLFSLWLHAHAHVTGYAFSIAVC